MQLIHFKEDTDCTYPVGASGTILAGVVGYILKKKQHDVNIIVSRKCEESSHDYNMSGIEFLAPSSRPFSVVIDDFMDTGDTVKTILKDIDSNITIPTLDMLCVDNYLNDEEVRTHSKYENLQRFNYVLCNKLKKKDTNKSAIINGYDVP